MINISYKQRFLSCHQKTKCEGIGSIEVLANMDDNKQDEDEAAFLRRLTKILEHLRCQAATS